MQHIKLEKILGTVYSTRESLPLCYIRFLKVFEGHDLGP